MYVPFLFPGCASMLFCKDLVLAFPRNSQVVGISWDVCNS
jgi:hypothetical protein